MKQLKRFFQKSFRSRSSDHDSSKDERFFATGEPWPTDSPFIPPEPPFFVGEFTLPGRPVDPVRNSLGTDATPSQNSSTLGNLGIIRGSTEEETWPPRSALPSLSPLALRETKLTAQGAGVLSNTLNLDCPGNLPFHQPVIGENLYTSDLNTKVLEKMRQYVIPGAEYDASSRDSPPRCHPGTRIQILEDIHARLHDPNGTTRMVWINGQAGVGKSAIMQTLAEAESSSGTTFATLFFSRPNERDDPKKAFPTIAYGLAALNLEYQVYIGGKVQRNPMFLDKSMDEQFQRLFVTPFLQNHVSFGSQRWIIFLDGLDECHGERQQCRIVDLIRDSLVRNTTSTPFTWVIASRPEIHLRHSFMKAKEGVASFWELEVPIDSDRSSRDVELYLHAQFSAIRRNYPDSLPSLWPSEREFLTLARASSGLSVLASTLMGYLSHNDPVSRLKHILELIEESRDHAVNAQQHPFYILDLLFTQIMSEVSTQFLPACLRLLGFYLLEAALASDKKPVPLLVASNTLKLDQDTTYTALRKLDSVLACPLSDEAEHQPIRFLHASFSDFLSDASRSQAYCIDLSQEVTYLWGCQTRILREHGVNHTYSDINLCWLPTDYLPRIQVLLVGSAQRRWMKVLVMVWATAPGDLRDIRLLIDQSSLIDVFRELGPAVFLGIEDIMYPTDIFTWLDHKAPHELRQHLLVGTFPLEELDLDRLFKSLCAQRWCWTWHGTSSGLHFNAVDLSAMEGFSISQWERAKEALWAPSGRLGELVQAQHGIVRVVGFEPAEYYIIVGPIPRNSGTRVYYILPYADL